MIAKLLRTNLRRVRRHFWRATAAVLVAALTVASLGIAVPTLVEKISDKWYPCINCSCSCASAEACWRNCCCYTQEQKLALAEANGVEPPAFVVDAAREEAKLPPCCRKRLAKSCCGKERSCCQTDSEPRPHAVSGNELSRQKQRTKRTILLLAELRCQGGSMHLTMLPPCVLPPLPQFTDEPAREPEVIAFYDSTFSGQLPPPELPPPEHDV